MTTSPCKGSEAAQSPLTQSHPLDRVVCPLFQDEMSALTRGLDVLSQIDAVDLAPDLRRDLYGFLDGESGVVVKIRRRVSERRLPKCQEALDVPALDVCLVRIHVNGEIEKVGDELPRRLPCMAVPGLQDVQPLQNHDVGLPDDLRLTRQNVVG
jgi:hypothetical protein